MAKDVLGMWNIIIGIFGKRGVFSQAISMTKLINLKQNSEPFENFINSFRDTLNALSDAGAPVDPSNATILFLNNINPDPFKNKIMELMSTTPIPTLEDCIKSLSDQLLLRNAMRETNNLMKNLSVKPSKPAAQHETVVNQVESARKPNVSTEPRVNKCFNCDRPGHGTNTCPSAKVTCSNCGKVGHMSKHCESSNRILANFNKKKKSKAERKVNRVEIFDDYFDDNYALTITADDGSLNDEYKDDFVDFDTDNFLMSSDDEFEEGFEYVDFIPDSDYISPTDLFNTPNSICLKNGPSNSADHESVCLIDSGSQENVVNHVDYVSNPTVARSGLSVIGIGGHRTAVTHTGMLKCLPMRALVVPTAKDSVLSLAKIVDIGYSMHCNGKLMEFRNFVSGHSFVARRSDRNFYEVDMLHSSGPSVYHVDKWPIMTGNFSKEQLDRAKGVRKLHVALGHVDDDILEVMLDRNVLVHCTFTSQDVRNAATALGRCQTCIAGKAVESSALPSVSPPANRVGEVYILMFSLIMLLLLVEILVVSLESMKYLVYYFLFQCLTNLLLRLLKLLSRLFQCSTVMVTKLRELSPMLSVVLLVQLLYLVNIKFKYYPLSQGSTISVLSVMSELLKTLVALFVQVLVTYCQISFQANCINMSSVLSILDLAQNLVTNAVLS